MTEKEEAIERNIPKNILQLFVENRNTSASLVSHDAQLLPNSVEVKSLIWEYDGCPVLVVLDESKHVDIELLAQYCGVSPSDISLATPERAVQLGGNATTVITTSSLTRVF